MPSRDDTFEVDQEWEDLSDGQEESTKQTRSSSLPTSRSPRQTSSRRRKPVHRNVQSPRNMRSTTVATARPREFPTEEWAEGAWNLATFTFRFAIDVLGGGIHFLRKPLSFLIFLYIFAFIMGRISSTLKTAFKPLCIIPGIGSTSLCRSDVSSKTPKFDQSSTAPQWADYPGLMKAQSSTFEQLLDDSVGGSKLSLEIKRAEMASSNLASLVKYSKLTSKDLLAESLHGFLEDARRTARGLTRLGAKVGGSVDRILAVNDYAVNSIAAAKASGPSGLMKALIPFYSGRSTDAVVLQTFVDAMTVLSKEIEKLIVEAEVQLVNLEKLEERLSTLADLISREDSSISSAKSELLSALWTKLGGNKHTLKGYDDHLRLLTGLGEYRRQALNHVVSALQTLRSLSDEMEDMRERVSEPELAGSEIPVDVHMKSIQHGLQRLKDSRVKAQQREEEAVRKVLGGESFAALEG